jgi:hypothetical protein
MNVTLRNLALAIFAAGLLMLTSQAGDKKPAKLAEADVLKLIELQMDDECIVARLERGGGVSFPVDDEVRKRLKGAGASDAVLAALMPKKALGDTVNLPDDPRRESIMVWVKPNYESSPVTMASEMRINGHFVNKFNSERKQSVGKYLKMGWNTITLKTSPGEGAKSINDLWFKIGPTEKKDETWVMEPVLWEFRSQDDWSEKGNKVVHREGPDKKDATVTYHVYFAGLKHENSEVKNGAYVLQHAPNYTSWSVPFTSTVFVNGTPLTTFVGTHRKQIVITPLLHKGKNEVKFVTRRTGFLGSNHDHFVAGGPAEYNVKSERHLISPVAKFFSNQGWSQDKKKAHWIVEGKPDADTHTQTISIYLENEPKR